ncbi:hypothetical protein ATANTOWER_017807 [Ataeniobius toweri]|uniref:Uncharacterized protein n=1 Tax=Ataeniobius toweri TaxID=208326 RepID=A0ABU7BSH0_9TELE|nr:hypothetical protein [Ataeniobius toweri]
MFHPHYPSTTTEAENSSSKHEIHYCFGTILAQLKRLQEFHYEYIHRHPTHSLKHMFPICRHTPAHCTSKFRYSNRWRLRTKMSVLIAASKLWCQPTAHNLKCALQLGETEHTKPDVY